MPRCLRFNHHHPKSKSLPEARRAACASTMKESKLDFTALLPPWTSPPTASPISPNNPFIERPAMSDTQTIISSPTTTANYAEVQHNKPTETQPFGVHNSKSAAITTTSDLSFLQFRPTEATDYARPFARAVLAAYRAELFPGASLRDRDFAERVVQGEGTDLVFRPGYIATNELWDGKDPRIRRAAFAHILGVSALDCVYEGCPYQGAGCLGCVESGMFEGCRHSHEINKKLRCSNCSVGVGSSDCSIRSGRKEQQDVSRAFEAQRDSKMFFPSLVDSRARISHGPVQELEHESESRKSRTRVSNLPVQPVRVSGQESDRRKHLSQIGPVLNDFFVSGKHGIPTDFDIWMAMRKRAIDYDPEVLAMECRMARLWSSVLDDELGKQKAAGFEEGG